jgi:glycine/D-amino acid oxidase-like deaminating enzyme
MERVGRSPVVVVGGGIVGSAIAVHLADRGIPLVLVDQDWPGHAASPLSFASISAFGKDPLTYYELACGGMASWARWDRRLGGVGYRRTGEVRWMSDPQEGRDLAERVTRARQWGYPVVPVDEAGLKRLLPAAVPGPVSFAAHAVSDAQVEPDQVLAACHAALRAAGARLLLGEDAHVRLDDAGVRIEVGGEVLRPSTAVLAAGAMSVEVAGAVGLDVPMIASPGMLAVTTPVPPLTDKVVYAPGGPGPPVHLRQRPDGTVLLGERSQEAVAYDPSLEHARALLAQAARFFPALGRAQLLRMVVAWRAMPADRLPIIGPMPGLESLYLAVTPSGVTLAPILGRLVAVEIAEKVPERLLEPLRPGRFAERATRILFEVDSVFRHRPGQA